MKLAVFDIDGTLTLGDGLGTRVYFSALEETFGAGPVDRRLGRYAESTDGGIAEEAAAGLLGRRPRADELRAFQALYLSRLEEEIAAADRAYRPVPGAGDFLSLLGARPGWRVAVATGNWRRAATLKLGCAGLESPTVLAGSEDGASRSEVLAAAIASASALEGGGFESVVYLGDQPWDLDAAARVGVGFLGVAGQAGSVGLRGLRGTTGQEVRVTAGYRDPGLVLALLDQISAGSPARGGPRSRTSGPSRSACEPG